MAESSNHAKASNFEQGHQIIKMKQNSLSSLHRSVSKCCCRQKIS